MEFMAASQYHQSFLPGLPCIKLPMGDEYQGTISTVNKPAATAGSVCAIFAASSLVLQSKTSHD